MARLTPDALNDPFRRPRKISQACAHPGCQEEGVHRAPVSRDRLNEYQWFCLDHVRAYNKAWDYFAGMDEDEIEAQRRFDTVWNRPTWRVGLGPKGSPDSHHDIRDDFGVFTEEEPAPRRPPPRPRTEEEKALAELELDPPVEFEDIKARYISLVKRLHPDANGANPECEERLKRINQAYALLRRSYS